MAVRGSLTAILCAGALAGACSGPTATTPFAGQPDALPRPPSAVGYPNLGDVPDFPQDLSPPKERAEIQARLEAERNAAQSLIMPRREVDAGT